MKAVPYQFSAPETDLYTPVQFIRQMADTEATCPIKILGSKYEISSYCLKTSPKVSEIWTVLNENEGFFLKGPQPSFCLYAWNFIYVQSLAYTLFF